MIFSGCYAGAAGIATAIVFAVQGGGGDDPVNNPPRPVFRTIHRVTAEQVLLRFGIIDDDGGPVTLSIEWRLEDGGIFHPAAGELSLPDGSSIPGTGIFEAVAAKRRETPFSFTWQARSNLRALESREAASVVLRISAAEPGAKSIDAEVSPSDLQIIAGNDPPVVHSIDPSAAGGVVPLSIIVSDSTSDLANLLASFCCGEDGRPRPMTLVGANEETLYETAPAPGREHIIFWDTLADLGAVAREISIEVIPRDLEVGTGVGGVAMLADNNTEPVVEIVSVATMPDRSFEVPIRLIARDGEKNPVTVILQWALENEDPPDLQDLPLTSIENPTPADQEFLKQFLASGEEEFVSLRRDFHILSEAPVIISGAIDEAMDPDRIASPLLPEEIREPDFVRAGLLFCPPTPGGSTPFGNPSDPKVFLIGREIQLGDPTVGPFVSRRIVGFDPERSVATLDGPAQIASGAPYRLRANRGSAGLSSSRDGLLHTFVWDSRRDLGAEISRTRTRIRATGIDSQLGGASETLFTIDNSFLLPTRSLETGLDPAAAALGDIDGDGLLDLVVVNGLGGTVKIFYQFPCAGGYPRSPQQTLQTPGEPRSVAIGDLGGTEKPDIVVAAGSAGSILFIQGPAGAGGRPQFTSMTLAPRDPRGRPIALAIGNAGGDAKDDLVAANAISNTLSIFFGRQGGSLPAMPDEEFPAGISPQALALGDLDGEGFLDIAVANPIPHTIRVFNQGEGGIRSATDLPAGRGPVDVAIGDLDGDGLQDIAAANVQAGTLSIFHQGPRGKFPADRRRAIPVDSGPAALSIGDLNSDGRKDLAVVHENAATAWFFLQREVNGRGMLTEEPALVLDTAPGPNSLAIGDLDRDGRIDAVLTNSGNPASATVHLQSFSGFIPEAPSFILRTAGNLVALAAGDLNGDGRSDLAALESPSGTVNVFLQDSSGLFPAKASQKLATGAFELPPTIHNPELLAIGDLDGDGRNDLASANFGAGTVTIFFQIRAGDLPFQVDAAQVLSLGISNPRAVKIGDLDGDGRNDLAAANNGASTIAVFFQGSAGIREPPFILNTVRPSSALAIGDVTGDGRNELAAAMELQGRVSIFVWMGGDGFQEIQSLPAGEAPNQLAIGDLNGDGRDDLVVVPRTPLSDLVFFQSREGLPFPLVSDAQLFNGSNPGTVALGDLNGDGLLDAVASTLISPSFLLLYHQGPGGRIGENEDPNRPGQPRRCPSRSIPLGGTPSFMAAGDLNGDGRGDIQLLIGNTLSVFLAR